MIYKNIKLLRLERALRQKELADYLEVAQNTYSQYETGRLPLTAEILTKLADYYGTSVDFLLGRTSKTEPYDI